MSLNNLQLPGFVVAKLYPDSLIDNPAGAVTTKQKEEAPAMAATVSLPASETDEWKHLGTNHQNILVVVNYKMALHLPDDELDFLTKMLTACKLGIADVAIINRNNYKGATAKEILTHFKSQKVFLFGIEPAEFGLPVSFPHYQVQAVAGITYLYTPSLEERHTDALLKSKLWVCLKQVFGL